MYSCSWRSKFEINNSQDKRKAWESATEILHVLVALARGRGHIRDAAKGYKELEEGREGVKAPGSEGGRRGGAQTEE